MDKVKTKRFSIEFTEDDHERLVKIAKDNGRVRKAQAEWFIKVGMRGHK